VKIVRTAAAVRQQVRAARARGERIGFVPTMGSLHEGHLALARRARSENGLVVASIFVNPLQFGPAEDFDGYPRAPRRDHVRLAREGVDLCYEPRTEAVYAEDFSTLVIVGDLDEPLCGRFRPGHFVGVATVVAKLLHAVEPDRLYLGAKDWQQSRVIIRMIRDLELPVALVVCPTVREPDGLALSSRNTYLSAAERVWAPNIQRALAAAAAEVRAGRLTRASEVTTDVRRRLRGGIGRLQYAEILDAESLRPVDPLRGRLVLAAACLVGKARLIDNVVFTVPVHLGSARRNGPGDARRAKKGASTSVRRAATDAHATTRRDAGIGNTDPARVSARRVR
jgi:pantoate--beta-alanine ligase